MAMIYSAALSGLLTMLWLFVRPHVGRIWGAVFETWFDWLGIPAIVTIGEGEGMLFRTAMPRVIVDAKLPDTNILMIFAFVTAVLFLVSFRLPVRLTPLCYLLRAFSFIQLTALLYFGLFPRYFLHDLTNYVSAMLGSTMAFISAIPVIMGFTYFIFDFSFGRKLLLTVILMAHLIVFAPLQYLIHIYIVAKWSLLFMPVLYIAFGLLPQIAVFIGFYSWGMSWAGRHSETPW